MAIYTSFEMIEDCRQDRPEGWQHLVANFLPAFRCLAWHYCPESDGTDFWARFLRYLREDQRSPLRDAIPMSEREFVLCVRDHLLSFAGAPADDHELDWTGFQESLDPLTAVEKQTVWLKVFGYDDPSTADLMRIYLDTATETRRRADEMLAERLPGFSIVDYGPALHRLASENAPPEPIPIRQFLRAMDGQLNWSDRQDLELAVGRSWFEVDRFCLAREADAATRDAAPISSEEVAVMVAEAGLPAPKKRKGWWFAAKA